jgi:hypothetical protein
MVKVIKASLRAHSGGTLAAGRRGPTGFSIELLLDRLPALEEYRYKTVHAHGCTWYIGLVDGVARFFCHNPRDESGYGGRTFTGLLENGSSFQVKGPWSSGPSEINSFNVIPPVVEASGTTSEDDFNRGWTLYSLSGVTLDVIRQAERLLLGWSYIHQVHRRHSATLGASEEQARVIEHPDGPRSGWIYHKPFEPCPTCDGRSFIRASPREKGAWESYRVPGEWTKACPTCNPGSSCACDAGIVPVTGMRWRRGVVI